MSNDNTPAPGTWDDDSGATWDGEPHETWDGDPIAPPASPPAVVGQPGQTVSQPGRMVGGAPPEAAPTWDELAANGATWGDPKGRTWDGKPTEAPANKED